MTVNAAGELHEEFVRMRQAGFSYREIGEKYDFSHERVRQIIGDDPRVNSTRPSQVRRMALGKTLKEFLLEHGPIPRDELLEKFEINDRQLTYVSSHDADFPRHLIILARRSTTDQYSDTEIKVALQRVWAVLSTTNPGQPGMSHVMYDRYRDVDKDPSPARLISRFDTWENVCAFAGVPSGYTYRPKASYSSAWTDDELFEILRRYIADVSSRNERPSYGRYDRWQRAYDDAPSGTTMRNRCKQLGLVTWPDIIRAAMDSASK